MVSFVPLPWMTVFVYSAGAAFSAGIVTFGAAPKVPVAVTTLFDVAADGLDLAEGRAAAGDGHGCEQGERYKRGCASHQEPLGFGRELRTPAFWCSGTEYPD